jgi:hypothetical protein
LYSNSIEHFPYTARRRWHIDVAQSNTTLESIDDSVDDRRKGHGRKSALRWRGFCLAGFAIQLRATS